MNLDKRRSSLASVLNTRYRDAQNTHLNNKLLYRPPTQIEDFTRLRRRDRTQASHAVVRRELSTSGLSKLHKRRHHNNTCLKTNPTQRAIGTKQNQPTRQKKKKKTTHYTCTLTSMPGCNRFDGTPTGKRKKNHTEKKDWPSDRLQLKVLGSLAACDIVRLLQAPVAVHPPVCQNALELLNAQLVVVHVLLVYLDS